jgi:hypothetical protein
VSCEDQHKHGQELLRANNILSQLENHTTTNEDMTLQYPNASTRLSFQQDVKQGTVKLVVTRTALPQHGLGDKNTVESCCEK